MGATPKEALLNKMQINSHAAVRHRNRSVPDARDFDSTGNISSLASQNSGHLLSGGDSKYPVRNILTC